MAEPKRYAIVRAGVVENVVAWDGDDKSWSPPAGSIAVESDSACPGDSYDGSAFTRLAPAAPVKTPSELLIEKLVEKSVVTAAEADAITQER